MLTEADPYHPDSAAPYVKPPLEHDPFVGIDPPTPRGLVEEVVGFVQSPDPPSLDIQLGGIRSDILVAAKGADIGGRYSRFAWVHEGETVVDLIPVEGGKIEMDRYSAFTYSFKLVHDLLAAQLPPRVKALKAAKRAVGHSEAAVRAASRRFRRSPVQYDGELFDHISDSPKLAVMRYADRFVLPLYPDIDDSNGDQQALVETLQIEHVRINLCHGKAKNPRPYLPAS